MVLAAGEPTVIICRHVLLNCFDGDPAQGNMFTISDAVTARHVRGIDRKDWWCVAPTDDERNMVQQCVRFTAGHRA